MLQPTLLLGSWGRVGWLRWSRSHYLYWVALLTYCLCQRWKCLLRMFRSIISLGDHEGCHIRNGHKVDWWFLLRHELYRFHKYIRHIQHLSAWYHRSLQRRWWYQCCPYLMECVQFGSFLYSASTGRHHKSPVRMFVSDHFWGKILARKVCWGTE